MRPVFCVIVRTTGREGESTGLVKYGFPDGCYRFALGVREKECEDIIWILVEERLDFEEVVKDCPAVVQDLESERTVNVG